MSPNCQCPDRPTRGIPFAILISYGVLVVVTLDVLAVKSPFQRWGMIPAAVLPIAWIILWKWRGLLAGICFLWAALIATALGMAGTGHFDNIVLVLMIVFGPVLAILYLGPIFIVRMIVAYASALHRLNNAPPPKSTNSTSP